MWEFIWRWETLWYLMLFLYIPSCIGLIVIVLLQKGKGVGFAGAFGIGPGSDTVFGPRASKSLPVRMTHVMAAIFMVLALSMSLISGRVGRGLAPDKVQSAADITATDNFLGLDEIDDLGSSVEDADVEPIEATPKPDAGDATTVSVSPGEDSPAGTVTVTPAVPQEPPASETTPPVVTVDTVPQEQPPADKAEDAPEPVVVPNPS